jgi:uncharacterized FlgJ-related protein
VRQTVEQNFDSLSEVFSHYGLEMSREAAYEKAAKAHEERGWDPGLDPEESPALRLVGSRS